MERTLSEIKAGQKVKVNSISCGCSLNKRLYELAIHNDRIIEVIKNDGKGPIIVQVLDSKIVLGRGEVEKILVEEI